MGNGLLVINVAAMVVQEGDALAAEAMDSNLHSHAEQQGTDHGFLVQSKTADRPKISIPKPVTRLTTPMAVRAEVLLGCRP